MKHKLLSIALLIAATAASAAPWTYRGTLNDGGVPATGIYDLRVTLLNEAKSASLSAPMTLYGVKVVNGSFSADVDFGIDLNNAAVMALKSEVAPAGSSDFVALGEATRFDPKAALAGICWDTTGNDTISPSSEYVGTTSNSTLVLRAGGGISINSQAQLSFADDLLVVAKTNGDADADLVLRSRAAKEGRIYVRDSDGVMVYATSVAPATQNAGNAVHRFNGRIRSTAVGKAATDTSGGMWMDDERVQASYVGRGDNQSNWTGFFSSESAWTALSTDDGAFMINRVPPLFYSGADLVIGARPVGGDADSDLIWETRSNKRSRLFLSDSTGGYNLQAFNISPGANFLSTNNGASLSNGGTWTNASSRSLKTGFAAIDPLAMLSKVVALPITSWTYKSSDEGTHVGPIAEDFKAAFGLAGDGKSISTVDADGVALAAIQGLNQKLEAENAVLKARLDAIEAKLK